MERDPLLNAEKPIELCNCFGNIQATHPKMLGFSKPWNEFKYWIAWTPYCDGDDKTEIPHIAASNDLVHWKEPSGFENPLEPLPDEYEHDSCYLSDPHLVYNQARDRLECWWRYINIQRDQVIIYRKYTYDGTVWSEKEILQKALKSEDDYISPAVIFDEEKYKIWTVGNGYKLRYWESIDGKNWVNYWEKIINYGDENIKTWHIDIIKTTKGYEGVVVAFDERKERPRLTMSLYYIFSEDNYHYIEAKLLLSPSTGTVRWDNRGIYRSSLFFLDGKYYLCYSGISDSNQRKVGLLLGDDINELHELCQ